ncbi:MAG: 16S rRNA (guanine(966)-N(2))-methyltransferase RsmD [Spirochaetia bacterium]
MHIIGGKFKGKKLEYRKNRFIRPMTQKVKESIYDIIGDQVTGAQMLDLFCGSGSVGIEAVSRGAAGVTFVDLQVREVISNVKSLNINDRTEILKRDVFKAIKKLGAEKRTYDIIFIGAPYGFTGTDSVLAHADKYRILKESGILLLEYPSERDTSEMFESFTLQKVYKYGQTMIGKYGK